MENAILRPIAPSDRDWVLEQHKLIYMTGHGFDSSFATLVAEILDGFFDRDDTTHERGWIAEMAGARLGSVFCMRIDETTAQLRLFFLLEQARGRGLGRDMVMALVEFAKNAGYKEILLWTHQSHASACILYRRLGWLCVDQKPTTSFGREEVIETYRLQL